MNSNMADSTGPFSHSWGWGRMLHTSHVLFPSGTPLAHRGKGKISAEHKEQAVQLSVVDLLTLPVPFQTQCLNALHEDCNDYCCGIIPCFLSSQQEWRGHFSPWGYGDGLTHGHCKRQHQRETVTARQSRPSRQSVAVGLRCAE